MGCDIHLFSEIKDGGKWHCIDGFIDQRGYIETISFLDDSRNYRLFAILAGVRSSSGVTPIVLPRGLPNDCSKEAMRASTEFAGDGHSHSWLSLD